jgi:hypothetical protein
MVTAFQEYWKKLKPHLDEAFRRQLTIFVGDAAGNEFTALRETLESGKKIRGCLVCMMSHLLGGVQQSAIPRAIAIELIQTATLIHDDFVDQDTVRRNRPATWTLQGARRAVLLGDVLFATAIKMMNDLSREDGQVVLQTIAQVARGAFQEPLNASKTRREIESDQWDGQLYEKIIHLKTGTLFGAACQLGAIGAQANVDVQEKSYQYGSRIGEAYQIADDLQEVKACLSAGSIHTDRMVILSPVFLRFVEEMQPYVLEVLDGRPLDLEGMVLKHFQTTARLMEEEIDRRLKAAVSEIESDFPVNEQAELLREAPWDLVGMMMGQ